MSRRVHGGGESPTQFANCSSLEMKKEASSASKSAATVSPGLSRASSFIRHSEFAIRDSL
jgi:hypothetical protein